jgi:membrane protein YqaA with SNARE-associated domain
MAEFTLFVVAFLAATLLPFSSEVAFLTALQTNMDPLHAIFFASLGNVLAIVVNYYLGYFLYEKTKQKLFHSYVGKKAFLFGHKYGYIALIASWLPVVGDPLTIVAGLVRLRFIYFIIIAGGLRVGRYLLLAFFNS